MIFVLIMFQFIERFMMDRLTKFDAVDEVVDLNELRALVREVAALAREVMAERDEWKLRHAKDTSDMVHIPEVTLDELARMATHGTLK